MSLSMYGLTLMAPDVRVLPVALVHRVLVHEVPDDIWKAVLSPMKECVEIILPCCCRFACSFEKRRWAEWWLLERRGHDGG